MVRMDMSESTEQRPTVAPLTGPSPGHVSIASCYEMFMVHGCLDKRAAFTQSFAYGAFCRKKAANRRKTVGDHPTQSHCFIHWKRPIQGVFNRRENAWRTSSQQNRPPLIVGDAPCESNIPSAIQRLGQTILTATGPRFKNTACTCVT